LGPLQSGTDLSRAAATQVAVAAGKANKSAARWFQMSLIVETGSSGATSPSLKIVAPVGVAIPNFAKKANPPSVNVTTSSERWMINRSALAKASRQKFG
jgi:hypothetical protein